MGKRKWVDEIGDSGPSTKRRREQKRPGDRKQKPQKSTQALPLPCSRPADGQLHVVPEVPTGLGKRARKRLRQKQKQQATSGNHEVATTSVADVPRNAAAHLQPGPQKPFPSDERTKPAPDRSKLRLFAVTKLAPRPNKGWPDVSQLPPRRRLPPVVKAANVPSHSNSDDVRASFRRFSAFLRKKDTDSSDDSSDESDDESDSDDEQIEPAPISKPHSYDYTDKYYHAATVVPDGAVEVHTALVTSTVLSDEQSDPDGESDSDDTLTDPAPLLNQCSSDTTDKHHQLATAVPDKAVEATAVTSPVLASQQSDSHGESNSDDEVTDPAPTLPRRPSNTTDKHHQLATAGPNQAVEVHTAALANPVPASEESYSASGTNDDMPASPSNQLLPSSPVARAHNPKVETPVSAALAEEASPPETPSDAGDEDHLPKFSDSISQPPSRTPANVGIKRQSSFLGQDGGTPSGSAQTSDMHDSPMQRPDPFDVTEEDSRAVMRALDEATENMLGTTRALPAGKREGDGEDRTGAKVTEDSRTSSRLMRFLPTPVHSRDLTPLPPPSPRVVICNSLRLEDVKFEYVSLDDEEDGSSEEADSSEDLEETVVDAVQTSEKPYTSATIPKTLTCGSSSSLSELSHSPSPPPKIGYVEILTHEEKACESEPSAVNAEDAPYEPALASRKKRKMTGRTSKHFSPSPKKSKPVPDPLEAADNISADHDETIIDADQASERPDATEPLPRTLSTDSSSILSELSHSPSPPRNIGYVEIELPKQEHDRAISVTPVVDAEDTPYVPAPARLKRKRKMTGRTSKHFTPSPKKKKPPPVLDPAIIDRVDFYNTTSSRRKNRVPAGVSIAPVPPISHPHFGIIQEKLQTQPFWLLIAVTFLNKTTGRAAVPVFWKLKADYSTPEALAEADVEALEGMVQRLGLQRQRSKRLIRIARAWVEGQPVCGRRWRTLHYPLKGDGKGVKPGGCVDEDAEAVEGALEIGHLPGCGPYAWDSWRIFCRDALREVDATADGFEPEWKRVIPLDKELRACLRWMWLKEGWIWNCESGAKRRANEAEMVRARLGEMEVPDSTEAVFAARAAGVELVGEREKEKEKRGESPLTALDQALLDMAG